MHHLFFLIFMVLVPFMQMQFGAFKVWGTTPRNEGTPYNKVVGHSIAGNHVFKVTVKNRSISEKKLALYTTIVVIITFISTLRKGPSGTFFYGGSLLSGNESLFICRFHARCAFFTFAFTLNTQMYGKGKGRFLYVLLTGICLIYCFFPDCTSHILQELPIFALSWCQVRAISRSRFFSCHFLWYFDFMATGVIFTDTILSLKFRLRVLFISFQD